MVRAENLFEAHVAVADLDASIAFYRDVLGLELAHTTTNPDAAFFWIGPRGRAMLGLWADRGRSQPTTIRTHIAFAAAIDDVLTAPHALRSAGITPLDFNGSPTDTAVVLGWMPAASIYFRDPDDHLLEYVAMLPDLPRPEWGVVSWYAWQVRQRGRA
jgi:lactoylglutathione lyase